MGKRKASSISNSDDSDEFGAVQVNLSAKKASSEDSQSDSSDSRVPQLTKKRPKETSHNDDPMVAFAELHPDLTQVDSDERFAEDDEIFVAEIPASFDPNELLNVPINFEGKTKFKSHGVKYVIKPCFAVDEPLLVLTKGLDVIQSGHKLKLQEYVKTKSNSETWASEKFNATLPLMKVRHSLLGAEYQAKVELAKEVQAKETNSAEKVKKKKIREAKKAIEKEKQVTEDEENDNNELIFKILQSDSFGMSNTASKKKKEKDKEEENLNCLQPNSIFNATDKDEQHMNERKKKTRGKDKNELISEMPSSVSFEKKKKSKWRENDSFPGTEAGEKFNCTELNDESEGYGTEKHQKIKKKSREETNDNDSFKKKKEAKIEESAGKRKKIKKAEKTDSFDEIILGALMTSFEKENKTTNKKDSSQSKDDEPTNFNYSNKHSKVEERVKNATNFEKNDKTTSEDRISSINETIEDVVRKSTYLAELSSAGEASASNFCDIKNPEIVKKAKKTKKSLEKQDDELVSKAMVSKGVAKNNKRSNGGKVEKEDLIKRILADKGFGEYSSEEPSSEKKKRKSDAGAKGEKIGAQNGVESWESDQPTEVVKKNKGKKERKGEVEKKNNCDDVERGDLIKRILAKEGFSEYSSEEHSSQKKKRKSVSLTNDKETEVQNSVQPTSAGKKIKRQKQDLNTTSEEVEDVPRSKKVVILNSTVLPNWRLPEFDPNISSISSGKDRKSKEPSVKEKKRKKEELSESGIGSVEETADTSAVKKRRRKNQADHKDDDINLIANILDSIKGELASR